MRSALGLSASIESSLQAGIEDVDFGQLFVLYGGLSSEEL